MPALLKWIDEDNLPTYLGGKSKATLLDDSGPWNDPALVAQIEAELKAVRHYLLFVWLQPRRAFNGVDPPAPIESHAQRKGLMC